MQAVGFTRRGWQCGVVRLFLVFSCVAAAATPRESVTLTYLGNAGWQIEAAHKTILVDPYLSEFRDQTQESELEDQELDPILTPDKDQIDARIHHADYILITHGHPDHMLDAPYISNKTGAVIICTASHANIARAYDVPNQRLIIVRGGEDFQFDGFSLRVIPSLHSPLWGKHYNDTMWASNTPPGLKAPLHASAYGEGGSLAYLLRIGGHEIFIHGSMNFIENEIQGLRPDIAVIGAGKSRKENYDYAARFMHALGNPAIVLPQHWVSGNPPISKDALDNVQKFAAEIRDASPATKVVIPEYFKPIQFP
jgi:L-ascorbate metabolism protein UlaG (beta-lactamase superfamily)